MTTPAKRNALQVNALKKVSKVITETKVEKSNVTAAEPSCLSDFKSYKKNKLAEFSAFLDDQDQDQERTRRSLRVVDHVPEQSSLLNPTLDAKLNSNDHVQNKRSQFLTGSVLDSEEKSVDSSMQPPPPPAPRPANQSIPTLGGNAPSPALPARPPAEIQHFPHTQPPSRSSDSIGAETIPPPRRPSSPPLSQPPPPPTSSASSLSSSSSTVRPPPPVRIATTSQASASSPPVWSPEGSVPAPAPASVVIAVPTSGALRSNDDSKSDREGRISLSAVSMDSAVSLPSVSSLSATDSRQGPRPAAREPEAQRPPREQADTGSCSDSASVSSLFEPGGVYRPLVRCFFERHALPDGRLDATGLQQLSYEAGLSCTLEECDRWLKSFQSESHHGSTLSYDDFLILWRNHDVLATLKRSDPKAKRRIILAQLFRSFDPLGQGSMKLPAFKRLYAELVSVGQLVGRKPLCEELFQLLDERRGGKVNLTVFIDWMLANTTCNERKKSALGKIWQRISSHVVAQITSETVTLLHETAETGPLSLETLLPQPEIKQEVRPELAWSPVQNKTDAEIEVEEDETDIIKSASAPAEEPLVTAATAAPAVPAITGSGNPLQKWIARTKRLPAKVIAKYRPVVSSATTTITNQTKDSETMRNSIATADDAAKHRTISDISLSDADGKYPDIVEEPVASAIRSGSEVIAATTKTEANPLTIISLTSNTVTANPLSSSQYAVTNNPMSKPVILNPLKSSNLTANPARHSVIPPPLPSNSSKPPSPKPKPPANQVPQDNPLLANPPPPSCSPTSADGFQQDIAKPPLRRPAAPARTMTVLEPVVAEVNEKSSNGDADLRRPDVKPSQPQPLLAPSSAAPINNSLLVLLSGQRPASSAVNSTAAGSSSGHASDSRTHRAAQHRRPAAPSSFQPCSSTPQISSLTYVEPQPESEVETEPWALNQQRFLSLLHCHLTTAFPSLLHLSPEKSTARSPPVSFQPLLDLRMDILTGLQRLDEQYREMDSTVQAAQSRAQRRVEAEAKQAKQQFAARTDALAARRNQVREEIERDAQQILLNHESKRRLLLQLGHDRLQRDQGLLSMGDELRRVQRQLREEKRRVFVLQRRNTLVMQDSLQMLIDRDALAESKGRRASSHSSWLMEDE